MSRHPDADADENEPDDAAWFMFAAHDPRSEWPVTDDAIRAVFESMLRDGSWGRYHGPHCDQLRTALADHFCSSRVHLCSSGTVAVELALRGVGVGPGDEVILCAYDFKANFSSVLCLGAIPVLVDCEPDRPAISLDGLAAAITPKTRAVIVSHLHGCLTDIGRVRLIVANHPVAIVEDACQCPGALVNGEWAGTAGDIGVLSFGGSKLLTAGRGGAVLTNDNRMAQRIVLHTQRGNDAYPLSEMQAAVLLPQLEQLERRNQHRAAGVAEFQREVVALQSTRDCGLRPIIDTPTRENCANVPAYYKLAVELAEPLRPFRLELAARAKQAGLLFDAAFPALHLIHSRSRFRAIGDLPNASRLHESLMVLHHTHLTSASVPPAEAARLIIELCHAAQN